MKQHDFGWLVGILEGEGCFLLATTKGRGKTYFHPRIDMASTDEDVVQRVAKLLGTSCRPVKYRAKLKNGQLAKQTWKTNAYSLKALNWMILLHPFMGKRRKRQIQDVIDQRNKIRRKPWGKRHG